MRQRTQSYPSEAVSELANPNNSNVDPDQSITSEKLSSCMRLLRVKGIIGNALNAFAGVPEQKVTDYLPKLALCRLSR
eukprot:4695613-Amphidinium_carterae.1